MSQDDDQRQPDQLPLGSTSFVGREMELGQLAAMLTSARLVTVTGTGGIGKTRLALRAAAQVAHRFADGVHLVELSALLDPELLPHTVAARLGLAGPDTRSATDLVLGYLRDRETLLVLDTCEHLIDACAMFTEVLLAEAAAVTVLATSRQPLDVAGENICPLSPLRVPAPGSVPSPGDAVDLFVQRAVDVPGFTMTADNQADVIRLCRRLDGIPLAVELAAVRLRTLSLKELVSQVDGSMTLLATESRETGAGHEAGTGQEGDPRHTTLRTAIGWSYNLCTPAEKALWSRLSVFPGAFGAEAAAEVCSGRELPRDSVTEAIINLVDKSVLVRDTGTADGDRARYRQLDTVRGFGAELLAASGTETAVRNRLVARYLAMARYFGEHLLDPDQLTRFRELRREHDSIRAALEYTLDAADPCRYRDGAELAISLYGYWHASGLLREGKYWLGKVLDRFPGTSCPERGWALTVRGYLGAMQGTGDEAVAEMRAGIGIGEAIGDDRLRGRGYAFLTLALGMAGRYEEGRAAGAAGERLLTALDDRDGLIILDAGLASMTHFSGDLTGALRYVERGLRRFGGAREWWAQGWLYTIAGAILLQQPGREAESTRAVTAALRAKHELRDIVGTAYCLEFHGWLAARAGRYARAAWLLGAASPLWKRAGGALAAEVHERLHQLTVAKCRQALGDESYDKHFIQGEHHPLDTVVELAIAGADMLPAPLSPAAG